MQLNGWIFDTIKRPQKPTHTTTSSFFNTATTEKKDNLLPFPSIWPRQREESCGVADTAKEVTQSPQMHDRTMADGDAQNTAHRPAPDCIHVQLRGSMDIDSISEPPEELAIMARPKRAQSEPDSSDLSSPPSSPETPSSTGKKTTPLSPVKVVEKAQEKEASPAAAKKAASKQKSASPTPAAAGGRRKTPRATTPAKTAATTAESGSPPPAKKPRAGAAPAKAVKVAVKSAASKIAKPVLTAAQRRKKARWMAPSVYTSTRSPLADANKVDLRSVLCHPSAWDGLSAAQQAKLLAVMPARFVKDAGTPAARPDALALSNSDDFRHDCARYVGNIRNGRHDPEWIRQAREAHDRRAAGDFDDYLRAKFKEDFDVDPPPGFPEDGRKPWGGDIEAGNKRAAGHAGETCGTAAGS
ncbi:hypothetical protein MAPG_08899 [Magnaporthiopsis poae ATCC 64411]|uniref:ASX DEUBAD domain-containing protein n=1 Tax=Magnaporthiopsis poae (strain ATCC 64411 / 73-15) TaxID=644358 RepID=A0A0C4E8J0_MAGP6|nr:hypothetical protein MAPG_08899 [Magnaporthiopsis poae ATCC 64411]